MRIFVNVYLKTNCHFVLNQGTAPSKTTNARTRPLTSTIDNLSTKHFAGTSESVTPLQTKRMDITQTKNRMVTLFEEDTTTSSSDYLAKGIKKPKNWLISLLIVLFH